MSLCPVARGECPRRTQQVSHPEIPLPTPHSHYEQFKPGTSGLPFLVELLKKFDPSIQQVLLNFAKAADLQNIPSAEIDSAYAADLKKILSLAEAAGKTKEALIPKQQALALLRQVKWGPYRPELLEFFIHQSRVLEMIPEKGAFLVAVWRIDHFARS